uniref:Uncharacterized protein n=1 Tax=Parvoviridae sp. TaxID=1940570 RepID=A0A893ABH3_9VIRU|nr:MAG: hypothetical protein 1 [Parvoviridae sp.]
MCNLHSKHEEIEPVDNLPNWELDTIFVEGEAEEESGTEQVAEDLHSHEILDETFIGPWQDCAYSNPEFYIKNLFKQTDQYIMDFYKHDYPDNAVPLLAYGLEYAHVRRCIDIINIDEWLPLLIPTEVTQIHLSGHFYCIEEGATERFCKDCIPPGYYEYVYHFTTSNNYGFTEVEMVNPFYNNKYFCDECSRFLFKVDAIGDLDCTTCEDIIGYDYSTGELKPIEDDIEYCISINRS